MILYSLIKNYVPIVILLPIAVSIATRVYNRQAGNKISGLALISLSMGILNWQNLMAIQRFCMNHHIGSPYLWGGGSGFAYSFSVVIIGIVCGHVALYQIKKNGLAAVWKGLACLGLLMSYPYLIWWSFFVVRWINYGLSLSHGHGA